MFMSDLINPWLFLISFTILIIFFTKRCSLSNPSKPHRNLPPSPPTFPVLGNLHQLGLYPHRSLRRLAQRHGPLMLLRFGSRPVAIVSSADTAREIMKTQDTVFSSRPKLKIAHKLLYQQRDISAAPYGEYWRQIRSVCVLNLLSSRRVQSFRSVREDETARLVAEIRQLSLLRPAPVINLSETFASLSSNVVCRVAFGKTYAGGDGERFSELLSEFMRLLGCFSVGDFIPWLSWVNRINGTDASAERVAKAFDEFLDRIVDEHAGGGGGSEERKDFVDVLLEIQEDTKTTAGFSIDRENIKAIILDMFVGGTDTTYTVLEWAMAELLRHPTILKKLQDEMTEIAKGKQDITESELDKLPYLKSVIKETLRLYPPIPLLAPRESRQDTIVNGFDVAAGTMVITNAWAIGRDPALWDHPEEFHPERFLNSTVDFQGNDGFQLIPFGGGRRGCPGVLFAMTTIELVLANLVHKFDWALPDHEVKSGLDMSECVGLILHRKVPLLAMATPRF